MRLDKLVSQANLTRSQARDLIAAGRVAVDGRAARDAGLQVAGGARVTLDGAPLIPRGPLLLMLNKPAGVLTAARDARRETVLDLIPPELRRNLSPVGRLDLNTTGLLLLTTDGQLAHRLISPRWQVEKVYRALVDGELTADHARRMAGGIALSDFTARPAHLNILQSGPQSLAELTVTEGKYHQVKRMFGSLGRPVLALHRIAVGGVKLDEGLAPGAFRPLTADETAALCALVEWEGT